MVSPRTLRRIVVSDALLTGLLTATVGCGSVSPLNVDGGSAGTGGGGRDAAVTTGGGGHGAGGNVGTSGQAGTTGQGGHAGVTGTGTPKPASCNVVLASDYDQSCVVDTDCVGVGEVPMCPATACDGCLTQAINKSAMAQYMIALSQAFASESPGEACGCPCEGIGALCRGGKCQAAFCGPPLADTLPACANAGGACAYKANTTCNGIGLPDACAYSDEVCCL